MDLSYDEGQELFKRSARQFLETYCDKSVVAELEVSETGFSPELWQGIAELGWMGLVVPEEYDGLESSLMDLAVLFEEVGRAAMPSPFLETVMATLALLEAGSEEQKKGYLPRIAAGELVLSMAIEEPEVNYEPKMISARAERKDDQYVLSGVKRFVPYASVADYLFVAARTSGEPGDERGITLFVVETKASGMRFSPMKTMTGKQFDVELEAVSVSEECVLGEVDGAFPLIEKLQKAAAALQCAAMVGGAQKEIEMTTEYTKIRHQFDRPIGSFQAVQHRAADMFIDVSGARLAAYKAIWCISEGMEADREVSVAKYFASKACQRIAYTAQHLHGGVGITMDYDLHFYYRMAKAFELRFGPQTLHLRRLGRML